MSKFLSEVKIQYHGADANRCSAYFRDEKNCSYNVIPTELDLIELGKRVTAERPHVNEIYHTGLDHQPFLYEIKENRIRHWRVYNVETLIDLNDPTEPPLVYNLGDILIDACRDAKMWMDNDEYKPSTNLHYSRLIATIAAKRMKNECPCRYTDEILEKYKEYFLETP